MEHSPCQTRRFGKNKGVLQGGLNESSFKFMSRSKCLLRNGLQIPLSLSFLILHKLLWKSQSKTGKIGKIDKIPQI